MIRVLIFLTVLALVALGAAWLADQPGQIVITWGSYRAEPPLPYVILAVFAFAALAVLLWTLVRFVFRLPDLVTLASRARRRTKGFAAVSRGMVAVGAGDPAAARRHAGDAERWLGREPLTLLLKAQAAQMAGDREGAEAAFSEMLDEPETRVLGLRGLFVEARRKGDLVAARAHATKAAQLAPSVGWANEAVLEFQCAERDWRGALATLERRAGRGTIDRATARRHRAVLLTADALERVDREPAAALAQAKEAAKLAPDLVPAATLSGRLLARGGYLRKAAKVLEAAWRRGPHPDLAAAYLDLRPGDSALDRLGRAETLMRLAPGHAEGRLAVAEAALGAREFKRARAALAPLLDERPTVRVCLLMADIEEAEHAAAGAVREWLARASRAPRDPAWLADGVISDRWAPVSPTTGRIDAFVWGTPVERIAAPSGAGGPDAVLADADEPAAPTAEAPAQAIPALPREQPAPPPPPAAVPQPVTPAPGPPDTVAATRRSATPVIFPLPAPPDDPGPQEAEELAEERPKRLTVLG
ncbi:heme biosynthesis HemY N-terminal domain-containing protein [Chelatococcus sp. SYSU_G07232]|uniref:Heme biosynthesis HemY N-terminal domain-containing protein n=1 Tax=Chelatococcus albus TaxID=3047466 RepID=A0ABT7ALG6_9HYPH|nr:heme biosynthesis HemY N-terminal domain-containing protein [Chelatococcus sp. SYSU_G07232]MDJ1159787.1 heme biosynthesis HemY N-terminal domain-containing protein [Chelatococcus sp. SYSU_G07232]